MDRLSSVLGIILLVSIGFMLNRLYIINPKFAALFIGMIFVLVILVTVIEMYDAWKVIMIIGVFFTSVILITMMEMYDAWKDKEGTE